ncbi:MAG: RNA 2'-phosphotransferase [archaeon]|nr:RNA 2'-phosphotransferase [archaeon]
MINECEEHGYFRRDKCPVCGRNGKFVMSDFEVEKLGRMMAAILRHGKFSLPMTDQGYVKIQEIVDTIKEHNSRVKWLRPHHIDALALTDPKGRYQIRGQTVRATYGHTIKLDLNLPTTNIPAYLYYPASETEAEDILEEGLIPTDRTMVHLSATFEDALHAGEVRIEDPVILAVDTEKCAEAGFPIGKAAKTVYLCDQVPADCIFVSDGEEEEE